MEEKIKVAILFGGRSTEHEISILSAQNVYKSLDTEKYEAILIGIDKNGKWHYNADSINLLHSSDPRSISIESVSHPVLFSQNNEEKKIISLDTHETISRIDVIFPVLHGTFGEDGSVQGLAKLANIPCVGCGILGSAVGMDKDMMKRVLRDAGIAVADWETVKYSSEGADYNAISSKLGLELFIKPANLGSSVGVSFSKNKHEFFEGLNNALLYDHKVIIEEKISGRELECAVLGNENPEASIPGEVIPTKDFYSYESKYLDEKGAVLKIPAELTEKEIKAIQDLAVDVYSLLECAGMARVDMFMTDQGKLIINEINTIPGFTNISMYPKLWEFSGLSQENLISELIRLAIDRHEKQNMLKLS
ncbi:MAG: D-alanine--D-alanine ligase [Saprospiraceae bacterium]|nr:D-alanine--D-alanine ligase [Saprospiraceae bacterium]